jgi:hypothetical protein
LGAAARDRARREFDVARMVEQYVGLYRQVLAR